MPHPSHSSCLAVCEWWETDRHKQKITFFGEFTSQIANISSATQFMSAHMQTWNNLAPTEQVFEKFDIENF
jgi:hypothetical protein